MKMSKYECEKCERVAGDAIMVKAIVPSEGYLEMSCLQTDHHFYWRANVLCPECGEVPGYLVDKTDGVTIPVLACCWKTWIPKEYDRNLFRDERAI